MYFIIAIQSQCSSLSSYLARTQEVVLKKTSLYYDGKTMSHHHPYHWN